MLRCVLIVLLGIAATKNIAAEEPVKSFEAYLDTVRQTALERGISELTIDEAFHGLERDERVIGYDRKQPEFVQTFDQYFEARVSEFRKTEGRKRFAEHKALLLEIQQAYDVDAEYLVAFWGLETSFGRYQGKMDIIRSLATLGHDPRRSVFFTNELVNALQILDEQHVSRSDFVGAWAGAMGQAQFMPSSFLRFAVDHDGDGKKNIWHSKADVFASIANYLHKAGWQLGGGWGQKVKLSDQDWQAMREPMPDGRCRGLRNHTVKMKPADWRKQGIDAGSLNPSRLYALVLPREDDSYGYLVGGNYRAIMDYNCANKYAVSVGLLADFIRAD